MIFQHSKLWVHGTSQSSPQALKLTALRPLLHFAAKCKARGVAVAKTLRHNIGGSKRHASKMHSMSSVSHADPFGRTRTTQCSALGSSVRCSTPWAASKWVTSSYCGFIHHFWWFSNVESTISYNLQFLSSTISWLDTLILLSLSVTSFKLYFLALWQVYHILPEAMIYNYLWWCKSRSALYQVLLQACRSTFLVYLH